MEKDFKRPSEQCLFGEFKVKLSLPVALLQGAVEVGITRHLLHTGQFPNAKQIEGIIRIEEEAMYEFLGIGLKEPQDNPKN